MRDLGRRRQLTEGRVDLSVLVAAYLKVSQRGEIDLGLSREVARDRAESMLPHLCDGNISGLGDDLTGEDAKDVAYALVEVLREDRRLSASDKVRAADTLYRKLAVISWEPDDLGERVQLLRSFAEIGWAAVGRDLADVELKRRSPGPGRSISFDVPVPQNHIRRSLGGGALLGTGDGDRQGGTEDLAQFTEYCNQLVTRVNSDPLEVAAEATKRYQLLLITPKSTELFDEREYLLGATAQLAAGALVHLGRFETALNWLKLAADQFARTTDPVPLLVRLRCDQLVFLYCWRKFHEVLELAPALMEATARLQMPRDRIKCLLSEALALKCLGVTELALSKLTALRLEPALIGETVLKAAVLLNTADILGCQERYDESEVFLQEALTTLSGTAELLMRGECFLQIGQAARLRGTVDEAAIWYRRAVREYEAIGAETRAAYSRVVLIECLISSNRFADAESELVLALPTIERAHLVPEAIALVALLRQAERRGMDAAIIKQLRHHLEGLSSRTISRTRT